MPQHDMPNSSVSRTLPIDRLELLLTTRRTYLMRLRSDLIRIESEIDWCRRYLPDAQPLAGDVEAAELLKQLIALKERSVQSLENLEQQQR